MSSDLKLDSAARHQGSSNAVNEKTFQSELDKNKTEALSSLPKDDQAEAGHNSPQKKNISFLGHVGDGFKEAGKAALDIVTGLGSAAVGAAKTGYDVSPSGAGIDIIREKTGADLTLLPSAERGTQRVANAADGVKQVIQNPSLLIQDYSKLAEEGRYGAIIGRGAVDTAAFLIPVSKASAASKVGLMGKAGGAAKYSGRAEIKPEYKGLVSGVFGDEVKILDNAAKKEFKLTVKEGRVYDAQGNLFDTYKDASASTRMGHGSFVMESDGSIYGSKTHILASKDAVAAGEIIADRGYIPFAGSMSKLYDTPHSQMEKVADELKERGIDSIDYAIYEPK
ncbi:MAG: hypothetical protein ACRBBN_07185 [Methyloligellaceae bacterium]